MSDTVQTTVTVPGENGLHLVPCSLIAQSAAAFDGSVTLSKGSHVVDAKNIFDLMSLSAGQGTQLQLEVTGDGAQDTVAVIVKLFESGFNGHSKPTT